MTVLIIINTLILVLAALFALDHYAPAYTDDRRGGRLRHAVDGRRHRKDAERVGCPNRIAHIVGARHWRCVDCGAPTCRKSGGIRVDPVTLQRKHPWVCEPCGAFGMRVVPGQAEAVRRRRRLDWRLLTDPIASHLLSDKMTEQFGGPARAAVRAFVESDAERSTVEGIDASTLNGTIASLALDDEVYAETRSGTTVLRRVPS